MTKREQRKEAFKRIGAAITAQGIAAQAWRDHFAEHEFEIKARAVKDPDFSSRFFGPRLKTQQFERTAKRFKKA